MTAMQRGSRWGYMNAGEMITADIATDGYIYHAMWYALSDLANLVEWKANELPPPDELMEENKRAFMRRWPT